MCFTHRKSNQKSHGTWISNLGVHRRLLLFFLFFFLFQFHMIFLTADFHLLTFCLGWLLLLPELLLLLLLPESNVKSAFKPLNRKHFILFWMRNPLFIFRKGARGHASLLPDVSPPLPSEREPDAVVLSAAWWPPLRLLCQLLPSLSARQIQILPKARSKCRNTMSKGFTWRFKKKISPIAKHCTTFLLLSVLSAALHPSFWVIHFGRHVTLSVRGGTFYIFRGVPSKVLFKGLAFAGSRFSGINVQHTVFALCGRLRAWFTLTFESLLSIPLLCFFVISGRFWWVSSRGVVMHTARWLGSDPWCQSFKKKKCLYKK